MVCPWWWGFFLLTPFRRWIQRQDPFQILTPYVTQGMTVLEPGPGMGYFTLDLARLAGPEGRVIAVDLQPKMLQALKKRAQKAGLLEGIEIRQAKSETQLGIGDLAGKVDFILVFFMAHEVGDPEGFFKDLFQAAAPGCKLLIAEPPFHVKKKAYEKSLQTAQACGFQLAQRLSIPSSYSALLVKPPSTPSA
jgi:ubiquinone/menaquinone biosynthesis C-methylase UbiE